MGFKRAGKRKVRIIGVDWTAVQTTDMFFKDSLSFASEAIRVCVCVCCVCVCVCMCVLCVCVCVYYYILSSASSYDFYFQFFFVFCFSFSFLFLSNSSLTNWKIIAIISSPECSCIQPEFSPAAITFCFRHARLLRSGP